MEVHVVRSLPTIAIATFACLVVTGCTTTASDTSADSTKRAVQNAMRSYVTQQTAETGTLPVVYQGKVLQLELVTSEKYPDGFHAGVTTHGNLYTSCADFRDAQTGKNYDVDFLVNQVDGKFHVVQPIVHKVDGLKNLYDLAH